MKKIFLLALLFGMMACGDDGDGNGNGSSGYPTDNLALPEQKNALLFASYLPINGVLAAIPNLILEDLHRDQFSMVSVIQDPNLFPIYTTAADSLSLNQPLQMAPSFYLNDKDANLGTLVEDAELALSRRPLITVNHRVSQNDTAWLVDSKVKIWRDTLGPNIRIETYFLANFKAVNYSDLGINLQAQASQGAIRNEDSLSLWDLDLQNIDSTRVLRRNGDPFYHPAILLANATEESAWGLPLGSYTPFGSIFQENDVIGTRSTPIRHYFLKPDQFDTNEPMSLLEELEFQPIFLTIVWALNLENGKYEYINSVSTQL